MSESLLDVKGLSKSYGEKVILSNLNFKVKKGEIFCVLGPSGCGKSTLLKALSGLEPSLGEITLDSQKIQSEKTFLTTEKRQMGIVFQDYSLFPHLNVSKNISFGLDNKKELRKEKKETVKRLLKIVGLSDHAKKYPHELSGGEQQRVAIARALAHSPKLLLFDEPFSNLDVSLRKKLRSELKNILKENGITAIFITHDQEEAFDLGDKIAILNEGLFEQIGTGSDLYNFPDSLFVANFIGSSNFIEGEKIKGKKVKTVFGDFKIDSDAYHQLKDLKCRVYIPSSAIEINSKQKEGFIEFDVVQSSFRGDFFSFDLKKDKDTLREIKSKHTPNSLGRLYLKVNPHYIKTAF